MRGKRSGGAFVVVTGGAPESDTAHMRGKRSGGAFVVVTGGAPESDTALMRGKHSGGAFVVISGGALRYAALAKPYHSCKSHAHSCVYFDGVERGCGRANHARAGNGG